jgi:hypothetical protein
MTRMELRKVLDDHFFRNERATRDFGWKPQVPAQEGMRRSLPYVKRLYDAVPTVDRPAFGWWASILFGMSALYLLTFHDASYAFFVEHVTRLFTRPVLYAISAVATALHVGEALYARALARRHGLETASGWFWQTLMLGYPSLRLLSKQVEARPVPAAARGVGSS